MSEETELNQPEQPEPADKPEKPNGAEHHPAKQSSGSTGTFLATLIALSAVGASIYLWQQQKLARTDVQALEGSINRLVEVVEQRNDQQQARLDSLAHHHHPQTEQKLARLETLVLELRSRLSQEHADWLLAEVDYLIRIADHRLQLEKDLPTAIAALAQAQQKLSRLKHPALQAVSEQLHQDIAALNAVTLPDSALISSELAALSADIPQWPFAATGSIDDAAAGTQSEARAEESGMSRAFTRMWEDIKGLVTIRRSDEVSRPLMDTEQRYFLQQNLRLKLEAARLALLGGHSRPYHDSLHDALSWLQQYYDTASPQVAHARSTLQRLAAIELDPPLPSLESSLSLLQSAIVQIQAQQARQELQALPEPLLPESETPPEEGVPAGPETEAGIGAPPAAPAIDEPPATPAPADETAPAPTPEIVPETAAPPAQPSPAPDDVPADVTPPAEGIRL